MLATPAGAQTAAQLDGMINAQSLMIAYLDDFKLMLDHALRRAAPAALRYKKPARGAAATGPPAAAMAD